MFYLNLSFPGKLNLLEEKAACKTLQQWCMQVHAEYMGESLGYVLTWIAGLRLTILLYSLLVWVEGACLDVQEIPE